MFQFGKSLKKSAGQDTLAKFILYMTLYCGMC